MPVACRTRPSWATWTSSWTPTASSAASIFARAWNSRSGPRSGLAMLELGQPERVVALPGVRRDAGGPDPVGKWVRDYRILLPFFGGPGSFEQIAFSRVLAGDPAVLGRLNGRYVLIGATAAGVGESLATPVSGHNKPMPGVELNANVLAGLAQQIVVEPLGWGAQLGWALLFSLLPALVYPHCRPRTALLAYGGLLLLALVASVALLQLTHLWFAPAATLVVIGNQLSAVELAAPRRDRVGAHQRTQPRPGDPALHRRRGGHHGRCGPRRLSQPGGREADGAGSGGCARPTAARSGAPVRRVRPERGHPTPARVPGRGKNRASGSL